MKAKAALTTSFLLAMQMAHIPTVIAQDDLMDDTQTVLESEEIDIEGQFNRPSPADRIEKMRKKLEQQNEQMVQKKIEEKRIQSEMELMKDLQKKFKQQQADGDEIQVRQAAPERVVIAAPPAEPKAEAKKNRITPYAGLTRFNDACLDGCESSVHAGLNFDTMVSERFSVGIGLGVTTMSIVDTANTFGQTYYNGQFNYNTSGDEIDYSRVGLDINSKFYFTVETKLRPFIGLGLGYERASLKYAKKSSQFQTFNNSQNLGDDSVTGSSVSGQGILGAELLLSDNIGVQLDFRFKQNLTNGFNSENRSNNSTFVNFNQVVLNNLGAEIQDSSEAQVNLGLSIGF